MNISKKQEAQWSAMYEKLKQFKQDQGHLHVRGSDDQKLVYWIQNQRAKRKSVDYPQRRIDKLDELGFYWGTSGGGGSSSSGVGGGALSSNSSIGSISTSATHKFDIKWNNMLQLLTQFHQKTGHCRVPMSEDRALNRWVLTQRSRRHKLSRDRVLKLNRLGFQWTVHRSKHDGPQTKEEKTWQKFYKLLKKYYSRKKQRDVSNNSELSSWVLSQRMLFMCGTLPKYQENLLEEIGFEWNAPRCITPDPSPTNNNEAFSFDGQSTCSTTEYEVGTRVKNFVERQWQSGEIVEASEQGWTLEYEDGHKQTILVQHAKVLEELVRNARPHKIGTVVMKQYSPGCFVLGEIIQNHNSYLVRYDTGGFNNQEEFCYASAKLDHMVSEAKGIRNPTNK